MEAVIKHCKFLSAVLGLLLVWLRHAELCADQVGNPHESRPAKGVVPITKTDTNPLSLLDGKILLDVQERLRWEVRSNNFDFSDQANALTDNSWLLQRFRIGMQVRPVDWLTFYIQAQDSREVGGERARIPGATGAEGDDYFDLRLAYVELSNYNAFPVGLRIGRQILSFGDERLVGAFDWNNFGRTFDAARLTYKGNGFSVDAFISTPVVIIKSQFNGSDLFDGYGAYSGRGMFFSGLHLSTDQVKFGTWDLYCFLIDQSNGNQATQQGALTTAPVKGTLAAGSDFVTLGTRLKGDPKKIEGWEFGTELAWQAGRVRGMDLCAFAATAGLGYNWLEKPWKPRLYAEYNYASGDDDPSDTGNIGTFQNLFPTNHKFYGMLDVFSWQNMHNVMLSSRVAPAKNVTVQLDYNVFWLADTNDGWYRANGTTVVRPVNAAARSANSFAGSEIDLVATWSANKHFHLQGGYSHFFAGNYLGDTGTHADADFGYIQATISF
jgi:hypothetical protein